MHNIKLFQNFCLAPLHVTLYRVELLEIKLIRLEKGI